MTLATLRTTLLLLAAAGALAHADRRDLTREATDALAQLASGSADADLGLPRFAFTTESFAVAPKQLGDAQGSVPDVAIPAKTKTTVAVSADGTAVWIASDVAHYSVCGDSVRCYKTPPEAWFHATALFEAAGPRPVAWHLGEPLTARDQALAMSKGPMLDPLPRKIDPGAEEVVKLFEATIGDPKAFAGTVSPRKDVVLYGSELGERYVGGARVRSQLQKWNLALKVQNGIQAGSTSSRTVAWVAAHVDARSVKKPTAKPTPYRLLVLYERSGASWKLVHAHFSFTVN